PLVVALLSRFGEFTFQEKLTLGDFGGVFFVQFGQLFLPGGVHFDGWRRLVQTFHRKFVRGFHSIIERGWSWFEVLIRICTSPFSTRTGYELTGISGLLRHAPVFRSNDQPCRGQNTRPFSKIPAPSGP